MATSARQLMAPETNPSGSDSTPANWNTMAVRRLGLVSAIGLAVGLVSAPLSLLRQQNIGALQEHERPLWTIPAFIAVSLATLLATRTKRLPDIRKMDVGVAYLVAVCAIVGVFRHALPYAASHVLRGFSPIVTAMLVFAMVVPMRPRRIAVASTLAALCDPLTLLGWIAFAGYSVPPWNLWLWLFAPTVVAIGLSVVIARFLYSLGKSLERAQRMGRYRLKQLLGHGAMGEVWLAEHDTLARPAALKLIRPEVFLQSGREEALARFEREAQATARLTSPHTIELYDYGVTEEGVFFYVMELLDGCDLEHVLSQAGALPSSRAVYLLEQICHSLRDAHEAGFIHRDVKPANIYVCRKGADFDFVKVLDFGLVKNLSPDEAALTQANGLRGTPDYMAPETVMGGKAEFAADVYAVGCVAYRMLAGRQVFDGPTIPAVLMQHVREEPTPLDVLCPHPVPADLARLIMRCLAKTPQQRPANAGTLLAELRKTRLADAWTQSEAADWWEAYSASSAGLETASTALADASLMRFVQAKTIAQ